MCTTGRICNRCTGFTAMTTYTLCKLIALYTANAYSVEREMSVNTGTRSMPGSD